MLTSLRLVDFKNFRDETLHMGPLTVIVGANASGKSNLRDAFRFLHGIGRGYTLGEIIGGKYGAGGQQEWAPIRGAVDEIIRFGQPAFMLQVEAPGIHYSSPGRQERATWRRVPRNEGGTRDTRRGGPEEMAIDGDLHESPRIRGSRSGPG